MTDTLISLIKSFQGSIQKETFSIIVLVFLWLVLDVLGKVKGWVDKAVKKKRAKFEYSLEKHIKIEGSLYDLLHTTQADRVYLAQLHNGEITAAKMHMYKFSISNEVCAAGISREKDTVKNVQVQDHLKALLGLVQHSYRIIDNTHKMIPNLTRSLLLSMSVESGMYVAIRDRENTIVAFLGVEYVAEPKGISSDEKLKEAIQTEADILQLSLLD